MTTCSAGEHDDCKHVLIDALNKIPEFSAVRWGQDHVSYPIEGTWTPSKIAQAKWVDVRFVDLADVPWNWHLTLENHSDRDFYRAAEDQEPETPTWDNINVEYNCWIDVVFYGDDNFEPLIDGYVRPWDSTRAAHADRLAELIDLAVQERGEELDLDKVKFATIGGWTIGHLEMALSSWYYTETGRTLNFLYDDTAPPSPMHERAAESLDEAQAGNTYEIGVLDNGVKVLVPGEIFEQLANMPPEAVAEIMKGLNDGPGSVPRRSDSE